MVASYTVFVSKHLSNKEACLTLAVMANFSNVGDLSSLASLPFWDILPTILEVNFRPKSPHATRSCLVVCIRKLIRKFAAARLESPCKVSTGSGRTCSCIWQARMYSSNVVGLVFLPSI
jgi:hypothetical protein